MRKFLFIKYARSTTMARIFVSILSISAISVIMLSAFLYYIFQNKSLSAIENANRLALFNIDTTITNYFDLARRISMELYQSNDIKGLMLEDSDSWNPNMQKSFNRVNSTISVNSCVSSIYVLSRSKILINCSKLSIPQDKLDAFIDLVKYNNPYYPIPWAFESDGKTVHLATILFKEPSLNDENFIGAIMVNMDMDMLNKAYFPQQDSEQQIYVVDSGGSIILQNDMRKYTQKMSPELHFDDIIETGNDSGSIQLEIDNKKYQLGYLRSSISNYYILSMTEYNLTIADLIETRNTIITICISILIVLFIISLFTSYRIYLPIRDIFFRIRSLFENTEQHPYLSNEIQSVSNILSKIINTMNNYEKDKEKNLVEKYFQQRSSLSEEELKECLSIIDFTDAPARNYCIIVLRLGDYNHFLKNNTVHAIDIQMDSIGTISADVLGTKGISCTYFAFDDHVMLIAKSDNDLREMNIYKMLIDAQQAIRRILCLDVTVGISDIDYEQKHVVDQYHEALELTNFRLLYGKQSVITVSLATPQKGDVPYAFHDALIAAAIQNSKKAFAETFDDLVATARQLKMHYNAFSAFFYNVASAMLKIPNNSGIPEKDTEKLNDIDIIKSLNQLEGSDDIKAWLLKLFDSISELLSEINTKKTHFIISSTLDHIESNYMNPDLTASYMADILSISPSYFSRIFNECIRKNFREYLINIRLEKAKEILIKSGDPKIKEICSKVGYSSTSYFIAEFKKKYGTTPLTFRQNYLLSQTKQIHSDPAQ